MNRAFGGLRASEYAGGSGSNVSEDQFVRAFIADEEKPRSKFPRPPPPLVERKYARFERNRNWRGKRVNCPIQYG